MRTKRIFAVGMLVAGLCSQPVLAQTPPAPAPSSVTLYFTADVQADGVPINIAPDPELMPALQAMVRKRVAGWRYEVGRWQGKPVPMSISQQIVAEVVPLSPEGFVLTIQKVTGATMPAPTGARNGRSRSMNPPQYPTDVLRRGVSGTFIYAVRGDAQGKPVDIELLAPERLSQDMKTLDRAARTALMNWKLDVPELDGVALECRMLMPIEFKLGSDHERSRPDLSPYRARFADACPALPELVTKVAGTAL